jgi:hypothetical protein
MSSYTITDLQECPVDQVLDSSLQQSPEVGTSSVVGQLSERMNTVANASLQGVYYCCQQTEKALQWSKDTVVQVSQAATHQAKEALSSDAARGALHAGKVAMRIGTVFFGLYMVCKGGNSLIKGICADEEKRNRFLIHGAAMMTLGAGAVYFGVAR